MGDLITRFANLFNLSKTVAVTVPGLIAAAAVGLMLRQTPPIDFVVEYVERSDCEFKPRPLETPGQLSLSAYRATARSNQRVLEASREKLQDCILLRTSQQGGEEAESADLKHELERLSKEREVFEKQYLHYVESLGSLRGPYGRDMRSMDDDVASLRLKIAGVEAKRKERQLEIDRRKADLKTVDERLADPGRLRPALGFADYVQGLTNKVLAFVLFAMALGFTLDPINRGFFGTLFDRPRVLSLLNSLRRGRFEVIR